MVIARKAEEGWTAKRGKTAEEGDVGMKERDWSVHVSVSRRSKCRDRMQSSMCSRTSERH